MFNLYIFWENFTSSFTSNTLNLFFILSVFFSIYVITSKNPIVSVLFLIGLFLVVALYLMQIGIPFIGLSYILVYVGAVSILFLFILMLINVRVSELVTDNNNGVPLSLIVITIFSIVFTNSTLWEYIKNDTLYFVTSTSWDTSLSHTSHITSIGNIIYVSFPIVLIVTSLILLLAMIGSIVITLSRNNSRL